MVSLTPVHEHFSRPNRKPIRKLSFIPHPTRTRPSRSSRSHPDLVLRISGRHWSSKRSASPVTQASASFRGPSNASATGPRPVALGSVRAGHTSSGRRSGPVKHAAIRGDVGDQCSASFSRSATRKRFNFLRTPCAIGQNERSLCTS